MPTCEITWVFPWKYAAYFQNIFVGTPLGDCFWATQSKQLLSVSLALNTEENLWQKCKRITTTNDSKKVYLIFV